MLFKIINVVTFSITKFIELGNDALFHLVGGFVGKCYGEDVVVEVTAFAQVIHLLANITVFFHSYEVGDIGSGKGIGLSRTSRSSYYFYFSIRHIVQIILAL